MKQRPLHGKSVDGAYTRRIDFMATSLQTFFDISSSPSWSCKEFSRPGLLSGWLLFSLLGGIRWTILGDAKGLHLLLITIRGALFGGLFSGLFMFAAWLAWFKYQWEFGPKSYRFMAARVYPHQPGMHTFEYKVGRPPQQHCLYLEYDSMEASILEIHNIKVGEKSEFVRHLDYPRSGFPLPRYFSPLLRRCLLLAISLLMIATNCFLMGGGEFLNEHASVDVLRISLFLVAGGCFGKRAAQQAMHKSLHRATGAESCDVELRQADRQQTPGTCSVVPQYIDRCNPDAEGIANDLVEYIELGLDCIPQSVLVPSKERRIDKDIDSTAKPVTVDTVVNDMEVGGFEEPSEDSVSSLGDIDIEFDPEFLTVDDPEKRSKWLKFYERDPVLCRQLWIEES